MANLDAPVLVQQQQGESLNERRGLWVRIRMNGGCGDDEDADLSLGCKNSEVVEFKIEFKANLDWLCKKSAILFLHFTLFIYVPA